MTVEIKKSRLCGKVNIPSSKSAVHRALISASLSEGESKIYSVSMSKDIEATADALCALGAEIEIKEDYIRVIGIKTPPKKAVIDCKESGSTLRFLIPVAAALGVEATFIGAGRLPERPIGTITEVLRKNGIECGDFLPLTVKGKLRPNRFEISGNVSSQFITGLIFAGCCFDEESEIILTSPLESAGYVDMTADACNKFGCKVLKTDNKFTVCGKGKAREITAEGDFSQLAFFLEGACLGNEIEISGLDFSSLQGDKACIEIYKKMGVEITAESDTLFAKVKSISPLDIDASQIPDLVPAIAVSLAFAEGKSVIYNAGRLRIKESDRLSAVAQNLNKMGIKTEETEDTLTIFGGKPKGANLCGFNDHRIVMAFSVALTRLGGSITDKESIEKSYPLFFEDFKKLGGKANVI